MEWSRALCCVVLHTNNLIPWGNCFFFSCCDDACVVGLRKKDTDKDRNMLHRHLGSMYIEKVIFDAIFWLWTSHLIILAWGYIGIESIIASTTAPG